MMPPVSLPLKGGTISARAGANANRPHTAATIAGPIIRIADSLFAPTVKPIAGHEKNGRGIAGELSERCCRAALDLLRASRHRPRLASFPWIGHARPVLIASKTRSGCGARRGVRRAGIFAGAGGQFPG